MLERKPLRDVRCVLLALVLASALAPVAALGATACRARADLVGPCFAVRGRAALYNGNPTVRIWPIGTRRLLGVSQSRCEPPECAPIPAPLHALLAWDRPVFGNFVLCPFTRLRPGVMQLVCIADASHLRPGAPPR